MDILVEESNGTSHKIRNVNVNNVSIPSNYLNNGDLDIFKIQHRVPDVFRYIVDINNNNNVRIITPTAVNFIIDETNFIQNINDNDITPIILIILESPHKDEYYYKNDTLIPKMPAQGSTGRNIETHIIDVIQNIQVTSGRYRIIISNPIPYMCSLGVFTVSLNSDIRNDVWKKIWDITAQNNGKFVFQDDFLLRCQNYNPDYIINCCTRTLKSFVRRTLIIYFTNTNPIVNLYEANHPAVAWGKRNFGIKKYTLQPNNKYKFVSI